MDIGTVSMRYAKALKGYAQSTKTEDEFYNSLKVLAASLRKETGLQDALCNPILSVEQKQSLLKTAVYGKRKAPKEFDNFVKLILDKHRENMLLFICHEYIYLYRQSHRIGSAKVITAVPIEDEQKEKISQLSVRVLHAKIEIETRVDPDIVGGFIFDISDYRLDASVATQLRKMKEQLLILNKRII